VFQELVKNYSKLNFIALAITKEKKSSRLKQLFKRFLPNLNEIQKEEEEEVVECDDENNDSDMSTKQIEEKKQFLLNQIENNQNEIRVLNKSINEVEFLSEAVSLDLQIIKEKHKKLSLKTIKTRETSKVELKQAENVDLCFLIDCTSSMSSYIEQVQKKINDIVHELKMRFEHFSLRLAFVGYRDFTEDPSEQIVCIDFLDEIDTFRVLVSEIEAFGGGDECEDVFSGLNEVTKLEWSNESRVLFHIADAPCHGKRFHSGKFTFEFTQFTYNLSAVSTVRDLIFSVFKT
jgi:hypothetical protein